MVGPASDKSPPPALGRGREVLQLRANPSVSHLSRRIDSVRTTLYNDPPIYRVYPLIGGGVAEWLKAAVC